MGTRHETEALYGQIDAFLKWNGLPRSFTPSLLAPFFASGFIMQFLIIVSAPIEYRAVARFGLPILGLVLGVISVAAGGFWDRKVFSPRYGLSGTWLTSSPWAIFPSGYDLKHCRDRAIEKLKPISSIDQQTGERVYRESKRIVQKHPARWAQVAVALDVSKFARNLILPFLAAAFLLLATFLWKVVAGNTGFATLLTIIGAAVVCLIFALWLFIPYFSFRIEHMIRLYSEVVEILGRETST